MIEVYQLRFDMLFKYGKRIESKAQPSTISRIFNLWVIDRAQGTR